MSTAPRPIIGVFDSGFGGLTVLRALLPLIPGAHFIYVGDTARLPYGAKSRATIARYAVESARFLAAQGASALVIACNTATALALEDIRAAVSIPVIGVVEPGAIAAAAAIRSSQPTNPSSRPEELSRHPERSAKREVEGPLYLSSQEQPPEVLVLATAATVQSHAYRAACNTLGMNATEFATPLLVPLVEEGWTNHPVTREVLRIYLAEALSLMGPAHTSPQAVVLGCTHYPLIADPIRDTLRSLNSSATVIDSAETTARYTAHMLGHINPQPDAPDATFRCYATDSVEKFARLGSAFLGQPIPEVTLLDLGG
jgi:glutamate racemase